MTTNPGSSPKILYWCTGCDHPVLRRDTTKMPRRGWRVCNACGCRVEERYNREGVRFLDIHKATEKSRPDKSAARLIEKMRTE